MSKSLKLKYYGITFYLKVGARELAHNVIQLYSKNTDYDEPFWEPFATLTKVTHYDKANQLIVDTNNCPYAEELIKKYKLGTDTGRISCAGYCTYPVYEFDFDKLKEYVL